MVLRIILLLLVVVGVPAPSAAVTVRDIIELSKAGLPDDVLVAIIDADRTIFTLDKDQILELKKAGISEMVLLKMLRSRGEFEPAAAANAAMPPPVPTPEVVVIGTEPERPGYDPRLRFYGDAFMSYFYVPFALWGSPAPRGRHAAPAPFLAPEHRGFGRFINDGWVGKP